MKKITFLSFLLFALINWQSYAQLTEDFETDPPSGWTFMQTETDDPGFVQTTNRVHGGTYSFYHNDDNIAAPSTAYMISPAYTVMTGDQLSFWLNQNWSASYYDYTGVWISTASNDPIANPADFVELQEFGSGFSEDTWTEMTYDLTSYVGQQIYVAFKYTGDFATELYIDDFSIAPPPACPDPSGMAASNITETSVDLTWTAGASETMWEVVYDLDPYTMPANGMADATGEPGYNHVSTTPALSLASLTQNTTYQVYYRAHCGGTDYSDWVGYTFTTVASPPANDDCTGAVVITPESGIADANSATQTAGDIVGATDSGIAAPVCDGFTGTANDDVWFAFTADATDYNITLFDTFDGVVEVFSGDCTSLTHIDCKDSGLDPEINLTGLTVGGTYYIRVYAYSSSTQTNTTFGLAVWRSFAASISDLQAVGFTYYPNPVSNNLTMKANENINHISIFNMLGQKVKSVNPSALETSVDLSNLSTGTYFVKAQVGDAVGTFKIVKE